MENVVNDINVSKSQIYNSATLPESNNMILSVRIRFFWSKKTYFKNQLEAVNEELETTKKELDYVLMLLSKLKTPFSLVIYGYLDEIKDNDLLDLPKGKEDILEKKRLTVYPDKIEQYKDNNKCISFGNKIDRALSQSFRKNKK